MTIIVFAIAFIALIANLCILAKIARKMWEVEMLYERYEELLKDIELYNESSDNNQ